MFCNNSGGNDGVSNDPNESYMDGKIGLDYYRVHE